MTEKQITTRLDKCYLNCCEGKKYEDEDEWWGEDDPCIWTWHRPSTKVSIRLVLDPDTEEITLYGWNKLVERVEQLRNSEADYSRVFEKGEYWS